MGGARMASTRRAGSRPTTRRTWSEKSSESRRFTRSYAIKGTPSLVVDGRYLTSSGMSETVAGVIRILEDLIDWRASSAPQVNA